MGDRRRSRYGPLAPCGQGQSPRLDLCRRNGRCAANVPRPTFRDRPPDGIHAPGGSTVNNSSVDMHIGTINVCGMNTQDGHAVGGGMREELDRRGPAINGAYTMTQRSQQKTLP